MARVSGRPTLAQAQLALDVDTTAQRFFAHGECTDCQTQADLAERLRRHGLAVDERRYSLGLPTCQHLTIEFDHDTENEASIEATATSLDVLKNDVRLVMEALAAAGTRCWVEVTDDMQQPLAHFHHQWPGD